MLLLNRKLINRKDAEKRRVSQSFPHNSLISPASGRQAFLLSSFFFLLSSFFFLFSLRSLRQAQGRLLRTSFSD
jgi:hypothetical protein